MKLTEDEKMLLYLYRKADSTKQCEAFRILDPRTVICSSISEWFQEVRLLRNEIQGYKKTEE